MFSVADISRIQIGKISSLRERGRQLGCTGSPKCRSTLSQRGCETSITNVVVLPESVTPVTSTSPLQKLVNFLAVASGNPAQYQIGNRFRNQPNARPNLLITDKLVDPKPVRPLANRQLHRKVSILIHQKLLEDLFRTSVSQNRLQGITRQRIFIERPQLTMNPQH